MAKSVLIKFTNDIQLGSLANHEGGRYIIREDLHSLHTLRRINGREFSGAKWKVVALGKNNKSFKCEWRNQQLKQQGDKMRCETLEY